MFFLGGLVCLLYCPVLPAFELIYLFALCVLLGLLFSGLRWSMWFIWGILSGFFRADLILENNLSAELENRHLTVEGVIDSLPVQLKSGQRFILRIKSLVDGRGVEYAHPQKIRLNWFYTKEKLIPGDYWRLGVKLKPPHGFMNPGGFDFESWLFQQRIRGTGYVSRKSGNLKLDKSEAFNVNRLRYSMRNKLREVLNNTENGGLLPTGFW
jgi:competence protein ComEC